MYLQRVRQPADLRDLSYDELNDLAGEIRDFVVSAVSDTGGHLGSNLGAVELTLVLHRVFESPTDAILWDTGHQAYIHKIVTGRQRQFEQLRQQGGLSGYPSREESEHDYVMASRPEMEMGTEVRSLGPFMLEAYDWSRRFPEKFPEPYARLIAEIEADRDGRELGLWRDLTATATAQSSRATGAANPLKGAFQHGTDRCRRRKGRTGRGAFNPRSSERQSISQRGRELRRRIWREMGGGIDLTRR